jgi:hypothetical protein
MNKIRQLISKIFKLIKKSIPFTTSGEYWERRYQQGGNSGAGSYDRLAEFKAEIINTLVADNNISTVIEFGSGDGNQLKYFNFTSYIGYDVSNTALNMCRKIFKNDPSKVFKKFSYPILEKADLTMSLDVIYHLIEDDVYEQYMETLFSSSNNYVVIYASNMETNNPAPHVRHRKFTEWVKKNCTEFILIKHIPNKYTFVEGDPTTSFADFYIFQKLKN